MKIVLLNVSEHTSHKIHNIKMRSLHMKWFCNYEYSDTFFSRSRLSPLSVLYGTGRSLGVPADTAVLNGGNTSEPRSHGNTCLSGGCDFPHPKRICQDAGSLHVDHQQAPKRWSSVGWIFQVLMAVLKSSDFTDKMCLQIYISYTHIHQIPYIPSIPYAYLNKNK